jgi:hypothetical protein
MGPHAAHELVASKPAWPPSNGLKDRDRTPVDRNSDFLTGGHTIEQGPCVIAQLARGNLCHATTVALVRHARKSFVRGAYRRRFSQTFHTAGTRAFGS